MSQDDEILKIIQKDGLLKNHIHIHQKKGIPLHLEYQKEEYPPSQWGSVVKKIITQESLPKYHLCLWNLDEVYPKKMKIQIGDTVAFLSTENMYHNLVETTYDWIIHGPRVDYRTKTRKFFYEKIRFSGEGNYFFICSLHPERMRIHIIVGEPKFAPTNELIIHGMIQGDDDFPNQN